MFVNPNKSLASAPSTLPLRSLQEILHNRIIQKKGEIHESHNRAYNERYGRDRKLHWVLAQRDWNYYTFIPSDVFKLLLVIVLVMIKSNVTEKEQELEVMSS